MSNSLDLIVRLSPVQRDLWNAMRSGVHVYFISGLNAHCFRSDTMKNCTMSVAALRRKGLIEEYKSDWRGCIYRPRPNAEHHARPERT